MTKEELEKEADIYLDKKYLKDMGIRRPCKEAYLVGAEPREEKIAALEALIKKMKCCANCENYCQRIDNRCNTECKNRSLWKLNEDFGWRTESN